MANYPYGYYTIYASGKAAISQFANSLAEEYWNQIDFLYLTPYTVYPTKMTEGAE